MLNSDSSRAGDSGGEPQNSVPQQTILTLAPVVKHRSAVIVNTENYNHQGCAPFRLLFRLSFLTRCLWANSVQEGCVGIESFRPGTGGTEAILSFAPIYF